jgi:hypothetical protein
MIAPLHFYAPLLNYAGSKTEASQILQKCEDSIQQDGI